MLTRILDSRASIQGLSEGVDLWPKLSNPEVSIHSFAGGRLTFLKLQWVFWWVSEIFLKVRIAKSLLFYVLESFDL